MLYRKIPKNGDDLSILGFGLMRLPVTQEGKIDEPRAIRQIRDAIDRGVTYLDTAWPYHAGESENVLGPAMADGYRDKVKIATKLPSWMIKTRADMDTYLDALKDFPPTDARLQTEKGVAFCQKSDIFKGVLWFSYKDDPSNWHTLTKEQVLEILEKNAKKEKVSSLEEVASRNFRHDDLTFDNPVGQDSLTRFDRPKKGRRRNKNRNKRKNRSKGRVNNG